jgi:hypothetical protein
MTTVSVSWLHFPPSLNCLAYQAAQRFELGSRLRRAAFSAAVNIVEGFESMRGRPQCAVHSASDRLAFKGV